MLIMEGKGSRGSMCYVIYWYAKVNDKYMNDHDTNNETYSCIGMSTTCMYGAISQRLYSSIKLFVYLFRLCLSTWTSFYMLKGHLFTYFKSLVLFLYNKTGVSFWLGFWTYIVLVWMLQTFLIIN